MAAALSQDLRTRVIAAIEAGAPCGPAAERFGVDKASAIRWHARHRAEVAAALVPSLRPGDTVAMDNLAPRKVAGIRRLIEAAGTHLLHLAPYNPEFNPNANAFAKLKALLRTAAARTVPDLWTAVRDPFTRFTPDERRKDLAAASYDAYDPA